jgi:hypothetical protein
LGAPSGLTTTSYSSGFTLDTTGTWDKVTDGIKFKAIGNTTYTMESGTNYGSATDITESGALTANLSDLTDGYGLFENTDNYDVDFLIMGSANHTKETAQALANKLIAVAEVRQDAIAFISPHRGAFLSDGTTGTVTVNSDSTITDNVIEFYSPVTSSTYAVFDSGYKYALEILLVCVLETIWSTSHGSHQRVLLEVLFSMQLSWHTTQAKFRETDCIPIESTLLSSLLETVLYSSVTRLVSPSLLPLIESTFAASSSTWSKQSLLPLEINSSSSTTKSQEPILSILLNHSSAMFNPREESSIMLLFVMRQTTLLLLSTTMSLSLTSSSNQTDRSTSLV